MCLHACIGEWAMCTCTQTSIMSQSGFGFCPKSIDQFNGNTPFVGPDQLFCKCACQLCNDCCQKKRIVSLCETGIVRLASFVGVPNLSPLVASSLTRSRLHVQALRTLRAAGPGATPRTASSSRGGARWVRQPPSCAPSGPRATRTRRRRRTRRWMR